MGEKVNPKGNHIDYTVASNLESTSEADERYQKKCRMRHWEGAEKTEIHLNRWKKTLKDINK